MRRKLSSGLVIALVVFFSVAGCSGDNGGYDMATDAEFNNALDQVVANEISSEEVLERFSDRYDQQDIIDAIRTRLEDAKAGVQEEMEEAIDGDDVVDEEEEE